MRLIARANPRRARTAAPAAQGDGCNERQGEGRPWLASALTRDLHRRDRTESAGAFPGEPARPGRAHEGPSESNRRCGRKTRQSAVTRVPHSAPFVSVLPQVALIKSLKTRWTAAGVLARSPVSIQYSGDQHDSKPSIDTGAEDAADAFSTAAASMTSNRCKCRSACRRLTRVVEIDFDQEASHAKPVLTRQQPLAAGPRPPAATYRYFKPRGRTRK